MSWPTMHEVLPDPLADSYASDSRVVTRQGSEGPAYDVTTPDGTTYYVLHSGLLGWGLYHGPGLDMVQLPQGGLTNSHLAVGYDTAGGIIQALIGPPQ